MKNKHSLKILFCDTRFYILLSLLLFSLLMTFTFYNSALERVFKALWDVCTSVAYWFIFVNRGPIKAIFGAVPNIDVSILRVPTLSFEEILNVDFAGFLARCERFPEAFRTMFHDYNAFLFQWSYNIFLLLSNFILVPFLLLFLFFRLFFSENKRPNGYVSVPARCAQWLFAQILFPIKDYVLDFVGYMKQHRGLSYAIFFVWLLNLNVVTVFLEAFAGYYYFISGFNFKLLGPILITLVLDVLIFLFSMPLFYWLLIAARIYYRRCETEGIDKMERQEKANCSFFKKLDITTLITGEPGSGKTTLLAIILLSFVNIFKEWDEETIYKYELYFPSFPFAAFRDDIYVRICNKEIYCLPLLEDYVDSVFDEFEATGDKQLLYGYDPDLFRSTVDVGNKDITLRVALKEYGKAFMSYMNDNPVIANFPLRLDGDFDDSNRLKLWNGSFFTRKDKSQYCHIFNQDMIRHGVKVDAESKEIGTFGPSIIGWTEISKDLGNQNTNSHLKADDTKSNAKNEKSTYSMMLARHAYTLIDNKVHIRIVTDDQRAANVMAAAVGLMSVLNINERSEMMIAIPGMDFIFVLNELIVAPCDKYFKKRENVRGDITLSYLALKSLIGAIKLCHDRLVNRFGYEIMYVTRQQGSAYSSNSGVANASGAATNEEIYLHYMKAYSDRFPSDVFREAYGIAQKNAKIGIADIPKYKDLYPSLEELDYQRSRLTSDVIKAVTGADVMNNRDKK